MTLCSKCQKKNDDNAKFCAECGTQLKQDKAKSNMDQNIKHFEKEIDQFGKKLGNMFDNTGKNIETWYDKTFGPFGPMLSSIIAFLILLLIINLLGIFGDQRPWPLKIQHFLEPLIVLFIIVFLISSYSQYLSKKINLFRFVSPIIGALVFIFWFWITLHIITMIGQAFDIQFLTGFTNLFEILLIPIALLILIIGYVSIITQSQKPVSSKSQKTIHQPTTDQRTESQQSDKLEYKRLYRSAKDRIVGGVLGGTAEYLNVDPTIIRILYLILLIVSFGTMILAYIVGWIIIPRNPNHHW